VDPCPLPQTPSPNPLREFGPGQSGLKGPPDPDPKKGVGRGVWGEGGGAALPQSSPQSEFS
jgi:hypothetical protein